MGPSNASTMSRAPSAMFSTRSTSPPKSAWPGVSMTLIFTSLYVTEMFLDRMVMPRSRSWSLLSSTRSSTCWFSRNTPLAYSRRSTIVVLPWSTCAMMATLRMFSCFMPSFFFLVKPRLCGATMILMAETRVLGTGRLDALSAETCVSLEFRTFRPTMRPCDGRAREKRRATRRPAPRQGGVLPC